MDYTSIGIAIAGAVVSLITSLVVWGVKSEITNLQQKIETFRQEVRADITGAELRFSDRINGSYVRKELYGELHARFAALEQKVDDNG